MTVELQKVDHSSAMCSILIGQDLKCVRTITHSAFGGLVSSRDFTDLSVTVRNDEMISTNGAHAHYAHTTKHWEIGITKRKHVDIKKCIMTWINAIWCFSAQITYWDAIAILNIDASWLDS